MKQYLINEFEKLSSEDLNDLQKVIHQSLYDKILYPFLQEQDGVLSDSLLVSRTGATTVSIKAGRGFKYDAAQVDPNPKYQAIQLDNDLTLTIGSETWSDAPTAPNKRIDLIVVRSKTEVTEQSSRWVKTAGIGPIVQETVDKVEEQLAEFDVVEGVETAGTPVAPSVPAGWMKIAEVLITGGSWIASSEDVIDTRNVLLPAVQTFTSDDRYVSPSGQGTDTTLAAAIANLPIDGGSILVMEDITLSSTHTLPANTTLRGKSKGIRVVFASGGKIVAGDNCMIDNLTVASSVMTASAAIELSGVNSDIGNVNFDVTGDSQNAGSNIFRLLEVSANKTLTAFHSGATILVDTSAGAVDLTLPAPKKGMHFRVKDKKGTFSTNKVSLVRAGSEKIEEVAATYQLQASFGSWLIACDGSNWYLV